MKYLLSNDHFRLTNKLTSFEEENSDCEHKTIPLMNDDDVKKIIYDTFHSNKKNIDSLDDFLAAFKEY